MRKIRIQMNDIKESVPVKDGYYLLEVIDNGTKKIVPSQLAGRNFWKFDDLLGGIITGTIDTPERYEKKDILAWGKIPED